MITVERLTRRHGTLCAVDDVSFTARPERVSGFSGTEIIGAVGGPVAFDRAPLS